MKMTNEQKAKEICDCDSCKACSKFAEDGAAYAFVPTCYRFDELIQAMQWKDEQEVEFLQSLMFQASTQQALNIIINNRIKLLKGE